MGLNATAAALLGLLADGELSGYELHQRARAEMGDYWTITRSQVYRELAGLARDGLVEQGVTGARARRPYRLTPAGRESFAAWVQQSPDLEVIRFPLLLTVHFGDWVGARRLLQFTDAQRGAHEERLAGYLAMRVPAAESGQPLIAATIAFGIRYEEAVLAWMDELPRLLDAVPAEPTRQAGDPVDGGTLSR